MLDTIRTVVVFKQLSNDKMTAVICQHSYSHHIQDSQVTDMNRKLTNVSIPTVITFKTVK